MKRWMAWVCCLALVMGVLPFSAGANNIYLIPDSDSRELTEAELWEWQYDALGFIFNEIFARHGFTFDPGGRYDRWFSRQGWYKANPKVTNQVCYSRLSNLEWRNERLVKDVRAAMRAMGTKNLSGKTLPDLEPDLYNIPDQFDEYLFQPNQRLPVYSGPGEGYVRGAKGKAVVSTNGTVYVAGWEQGWLLVLYRTNAGAARMGYVSAASIKGEVYADQLMISRTPATLTRACALSDDPVTGSPLAQLPAGAAVTFLFPVTNSGFWAYVEAQTPMGPARGCVPMDAVSY